MPPQTKSPAAYSVTISAAGGAIGSSTALPSEEAVQWFLKGISAGCSIMHGSVTLWEGTRPLVQFDVRTINDAFLLGRAQQEVA